MLTILTSLLLTMQHIQSIINNYDQTEKSAANSQTQESVFRTQEKKLKLAPLPLQDLSSPF